jgi:hypothetical protein
MGTVGGRCIKGCEGYGKKELGEEILEDIILKNPIVKTESEKDLQAKYGEETKNICKSRNANINKIIEENGRK